MNKKYIPQLTGIRAICVYFIFFKHLDYLWEVSFPKTFIFTQQFYSFLDFFFVLSGFVIFYKYGELIKSTKHSYYNYFINRISRVFPILIILTTLTFIIEYRAGLYQTAEAIKLYLLNITLVKGFSSDYQLTGIGPSWSLSVEELFYLVSPLIFLYVANKKNLIKLLLLFYTIGFLITFIFIRFPFQGFFSSYLFTAHSTFFGRFFEFACGIYLSMLAKGAAQNKWLNSLGKYTLPISLIIIVGSLFCMYFIAMHYHVSHASNVWAGVLVSNIIMPIGIGLFFYNLIYFETGLSRFLSTKLMVTLGNATYSFYLLHTTFILSLIFKYIGHNVFTTFIIMMIISVIFNKTVEEPLAVWLRKKLSKKEKIASE